MPSTKVDLVRVKFARQRTLADMEGKLLYVLLALVASAAASSIYAGIDPTRIYAGGEITFPRIPGINAPLFNFGNLFSFSDDSNSSGSVNSTSSYNYTGSPFGPFTPFLRLIPGLNLLIPNSGQAGLPGFPNIDNIIMRIPGVGTKNVSIPAFNITSGNSGPYIPGVSEALTHARQHLQAALNITSDLSTGLREAVRVALSSDTPVASFRIILDTIARVYATVAANCPLMIIGTRVLAEGIRLSGEVVRSIANIATGP